MPAALADANLPSLLADAMMDVQWDGACGRVRARPLTRVESMPAPPSQRLAARSASRAFTWVDLVVSAGERDEDLRRWVVEQTVDWQGRCGWVPGLAT